MKTDQIKEKYLSSVIYYTLLEKKEERLLFILSVFRLLTFVGGLVLIWLSFTKSVPAGIITLLLITVLFLYLLKLYSRHTDKKEFLRNLALINKNESAALSGDLSAFEAGSSYTDIRHDFSYDVDLFGKSSLFQYINRTTTKYGRDILAHWLSEPFRYSDEFLLRQDTIKELALKDEWRHEFLASGMKAPLEKNDISDLLRWLEEGNVITSSPVRKFLIFFLPAVALISLILTIAGLLTYSVFIFIFLCNLFYVVAGIKKTNGIHNALSGKYSFLSSLNGLLNAFENETFTSSGLNEIKLNISGKTDSAAYSVRKLERLIHAFDSRINMIAGLILNGLFLWDYHCIFRLERWKLRYKNHFPGWLEMIGQVDAFISLGNYAFNNPDFIYPVRSDNLNVFSAKNLGHQLIEESKRVCNDFSIGKKGTVCIISGANMAGKSTFLRTIAINYVLGMVGAPVCASEMNFNPVKLFTSMRTTDSLSENESYFYAELRRLKILKSRVENGEPVFFILDEILKGTNSADKNAGSKLFLQKIVESGGTGLIATHDTSLGKLEDDYPGMIINKCFEIEIDGENISFDYKIQNGITQKMNAVFLMKQLGILD
jgi:ABC-type multidrug transport system fused ATPase/permease subunit